MPYLLVLASLLVAPVSPKPSLQVEPSLQVRWVDGSGDRLTTVAGYTVVEYRNAGEGGLEWALAGEGRDGGNGPSQLWLYDAPRRAFTALTAPSEAVAFMTAGDHNDGFATFLVDGVEVGTFDMHRRGEQTLVVEGLDRAAHHLEVRAEGRKSPRSQAAHVAVYGGAALSNEAVTWGRAPSPRAPR